MMNTALSLYVHIPFCATKCPYCDFNTYAGIESQMPGYVAALREEIDIWGRVLRHRRLETVFFGGGTPSYLPAEDVDALLAAIRHAFDVEEGAEVTLESNPDDLTPDKLDALRRSGVNRLSIGVQSLDDGLLEVLGRRHSAEDALRSYHMAYAAGFDNISIDLMYGLPRQDMDQWRRTLSAAAELRPSHVSLYCLTLEGGVPMERWVGSGRLPEPDTDLAADMYLMAEEAMEAAGYRHYEISNWALPGMESRHNLTYWKNEPYLGVGPGAHSYLDGHRFHNLRSPREYVRRLRPLQSVDRRRVGALDAGAFRRVPVVEDVEVIDRRLEMAETMMMGLRLDTGIIAQDFARRFGVTPAQVYGDTIDELRGDGLLEAEKGTLRLTGRGRLLGNEVFSRLF